MTTISSPNLPASTAVTSSVVTLRPDPATRAFWPAFWLAVGMIGCKAVCISLSGWTLGGILRFAADLALATHLDLLYAAAGGLLFYLLLRALQRWPRIQLGAWILFLLLCFASLIYAMLSVSLFQYVGSPLTRRLIYLAGRANAMTSSASSFASPATVAIMLLVPSAWLALTGLSLRWVKFRIQLHLRILALAALTGYLLLMATAAGANWTGRNDPLLTLNPHWALIGSYLESDALWRPASINEPFTAEYVEEFLPISERPEEGLPTAGIARGPKNVIVVVLESVAVKYLSVYGCRYQTTPRLESEAGSSLVFDNIYAHAGNTANSMVALTLSIYPGLSGEKYTIEHPRVAGVTLAQALKGQGYRTAFITSADNQYDDQGIFLSGRGYDELWDYRKLGKAELLSSWGGPDEEMIDGVLRFIDLDRTRPFYITSWTHQTHHPYVMSFGQEPVAFPGAAETWHLDRYLNTLLEADRLLGRLFDALRERGLADDTLVVITGDHGEAFGTHKGWGHSGRVYQEDSNIPLILWNPQLFKGAGRSATVGGHVDLCPTIADILGLPLPAPWQGRSLFSAARRTRDRAYFYGLKGDSLALREGPWKYIYSTSTGHEELYNLPADPEERDNAASLHPELCQLMKQRLAAWADYQAKHLEKLK